MATHSEFVHTQVDLVFPNQLGLLHVSRGKVSRSAGGRSDVMPSRARTGPEGLGLRPEAAIATTVQPLLEV